MQKQNNLFKYKNALTQQFKLNWKLFLFFFIAWNALVVLMMVIPLTQNDYGSGKMPLIAPGMINIVFENGSLGSSIVSFSIFLETMIFGCVGIGFFAIFTISMLAITTNYEIKSGQFCFWATLPLSRNKIYLTKIITILFQNIAIYLVSFIVIIAMTATAGDASEALGSVVLWGFEFLLFIIMLCLGLALIFLAFLEKPSIAIIISSLLLIYIATTWLVLFIPDVSGWTNDSTEPKPVLLVVQDVLKYFAPQSLIVNPLKFKPDLVEWWVSGIIDGGKTTIYRGVLEGFSTTSAIICNLAMPIISGALLTFNIWWFNKIDLNI